MPGRNPGTSTRVRMGMLKASQNLTKRAPLTEEFMSMTPALNLGWLATIPIEWPLILANVVIIDRKSTRLNSSHSQISYAVFCLKKKKNHMPDLRTSQTTSDKDSVVRSLGAPITPESRHSEFNIHFTVMTAGLPDPIARHLGLRQ